MVLQFSWGRNDHRVDISNGETHDLNRADNLSIKLPHPERFVSKRDPIFVGREPVKTESIQPRLKKLLLIRALKLQAQEFLMGGRHCSLWTNLSYKLPQGHGRRFRISILNVLWQFPKLFNNRVGKVMDLNCNYGLPNRSLIEMKLRIRHSSILGTTRLLYVLEADQRVRLES